MLQDVGPSGLHHLLQELEQLLQLRHLSIEAVAPFLHFHQVYEAEEAVLFVLQVLPKHIHEVVHALAVANLQVELRVGVEYVVEGVLACRRIRFVGLELRPCSRQVLAQDARVFEWLLLAEVISIEVVPCSEVGSLGEGLDPLVIIEFLQHLML